MLERIPLFAGLSEAERAGIEQHSVTRTYRKNTPIVEKGDESDSLYVILSGKVKVYVAEEDGKEIILNEMGPSEYFGELALLGETRRTASVMTTEKSRFLIITKRTFLDVLAGNPELAPTLLRSLVERVRALTELVSNLALLDAYGRVVRVLLDHAKEQDGRLVTGKLTQQDIANRAGCTREMVSRISSDLRKGGYITVDDKQITIMRKLPSRW